MLSAKIIIFFDVEKIRFICAGHVSHQQTSSFSLLQTVAWFGKIALSFLKSQICLVISNCIAPYLFPYFIPIYGDGLPRRWAAPWLFLCEIKMTRMHIFHFHVSFSCIVFIGLRWLHAYENAVSFHFSNYFVSYLSETTTVMAGAGFSEHKDNLKWSVICTPAFSLSILF